MFPRAVLLLILPTLACAQAPAAPKPPVVHDPALRIELLATVPEVEACTTVCGAPDGSFYVGIDPRDGRLNTSQPVNKIVRYSSMGADRQRTVFADRLYSPAGTAWHDGWLYVMHDPVLSRFKDTDGDGVAEVREDLITHLGIVPNDGLNDHVVSGLTLGMDGYFYISVGDRGIHEARSVRDGSTVTMQGGGIIRCRPDGTQLEIFSTGTRNHLSVSLDAEDNAFTRDNTDDGNGWYTRLTHHIEGGYYGYPFDYKKAPNYGVVLPSRETLNAIQEHGGTATVDRGLLVVDGGSTPAPTSGQSTINSQSSTLPFLPAMADFGGGAPTGALCYLSDGLPEKYRGKHFFSEWGKQGVFVTEVARDGATFKLVSDTQLISAAKGGEFRPMQLSVAADGSLLIADWGYGGWKGPRVAGAVWRLSWPEAKIAPRLADENKATVEQLIAALGHPDRDQRLRAEYELEAADRRNEPLAKTLAKLAGEQDAPSIARIHALWALAFQPGGLTEISRGSSAAATPGPTAPSIHPGGAAEANATTPQTSAADGKPRVSPEANLPQPSGLAADGPPRTVIVDAISTLLSSTPPELRAQAARALGELRAASALDALVECFRASSSAGRLSVITALARIGFIPGAGLDAAEGLTDADAWVRFGARRMIQRHGDLGKIAAALRNPADPLYEAAWLTASGSLDPYWAGLSGVESFTKFSDTDPTTHARAITALGRIAYRPAPYDGHWWGTQPVKNPPPRNPVAWAGTPKALATLTAALGDADSGVRLAAAKAFTGFILDDLGKDAATALRTCLTAESEPAVRRQLIQALGVQKDPEAVEVFRQIALDEKADADFRETAIGALVSIGAGGNASATDAAARTIAQLADAHLSPAATRTIIKAAGELKVLAAAPALIAHLHDATAGDRELSIKALQQLGPKSGASSALIDALADDDARVQAAAIDALGSFREKAALPALLALAAKGKPLKEIAAALAEMPDESAIPALVEMLREKSNAVRRNAIKTLATMREKARPPVEALLASGRVPAEFVPEIRAAFESGAITQWKMVGVFENVWDAQHPPETEALAHGGAANLAAKYHNAEGNDVGWIDVPADAAEGRVDLGEVFKTKAMVCAYAFTEIEAPEAAEAKLFTGADDEIAVWLNGARVLNVAGIHSFEVDRSETPLPLRAGKNELLVKIGNQSGAWLFHARIPGLDNGRFVKSKEPTPEEKQRTFALATGADGSYLHPGDAAKGAKIFADPAGPLGGICATCHAVKGKGGQVGPDLGTIAANYKRPDLITSIHEPSKTIALGFEQVLVETKGGETFAGALRQETADSLTLVGVDAQPHVVRKADVKTETHLPTSLMPQGLTLGLKPEDFADLLAYLETLR